MAYISAWNTVAWSPKLKLCPFLDSHLYNSASVPLSVLDPYMCTRPGPIWCPVGICSVTHNCQGTCGTHISVSSHQSPSVRWVQASYPYIFSTTKVCGFRFPPQFSLKIPASFITWRRGSPERASIASDGVIFITPVTASQAKFCNLLTSLLLALHLTLGHNTVQV